ncbi:MAG: flavodoxin-dependent (E)-4-hydroxy-3-methylbut-2-enyl-diphosphate synthase [Firmicutes bacterium]|nr:flavodoxin-dependent (E)-4-hydroxy-3-methylbut-2-enyl-diphosphate synthase [Bacillota bacterium]
MSKRVYCGDVAIGGGAPISIQSMTNVDARNEKGLREQIARLEDAGCQIIRMAVPDREAAQILGHLKGISNIKGVSPSKPFTKVPIVADIHFDHRLAIAAIKNGADKIRINPGNIGDREQVKAVVKAAKEHQIPIRVGVNSGSLEQNIIMKYGKVSAEGMAESALQNLRMIEDMGYYNLVVSLKSSNLQMNYQAHKILAANTNHPIHIGITEAGTVNRGKVKSAMGIGALLLEGIGDTMRVSLTADPVEEVYFAKEILGGLGLRKSSINLVSCPTCGRIGIDLPKLATEIEEQLVELEAEWEKEGRPAITVAVMGCGVNGPGEAKEADYGVAGGDGRGLLFAKGRIVGKVFEEDIVSALMKLIREGAVDQEYKPGEVMRKEH